jgi:NAD(P) transhydrogenase subunit alpha
MTHESLIAALYVFALAAFLGYQVISRVPPLLHTPLMSATNAISGISLVGSIVTAGARYNTVSTILGFIAVVCSTTNVVGGFVITDRMLRMFKRKPPKKSEVRSQKSGGRSWVESASAIVGDTSSRRKTRKIKEQSTKYKAQRPRPKTKNQDQFFR